MNRSIQKDFLFHKKQIRTQLTKSNKTKDSDYNIPLTQKLIQFSICWLRITCTCFLLGPILYSQLAWMRNLLITTYFFFFILELYCSNSKSVLYVETRFADEIHPSQIVVLLTALIVVGRL